ncbi:MAG: hypothetical protein FWC70_02320 [Defluviitaleaceae bacterium]|nr:hypothetical protein [Defluviitaleaceae bacterium]
METKGLLALNYVSDGVNFHCTCACGTKIILSEEQLNRIRSCGCASRKLLLAQTDIADDTSEMEKLYQLESNEIRGVNFEPSKGKWRARVTFQSKEYHLGYFSEQDDALKQRHEAEKHLNDDFPAWFRDNKK